MSYGHVAHRTPVYIHVIHFYRDCLGSSIYNKDDRPDHWFAEKFSYFFLCNHLRKQVYSTPDRKNKVTARPLIGWYILDFSSETAQRNLMKLDRKQDLNVIYQVLFRSDWKSKIATTASDWLRHFRLLLWNRWTEFNETWQEARSQRPLPSLCFFRPIRKKDGHTGLWLADTFSTFPLKLLNGIQRNLTGSKITTSSTKFVFFGPMGKTRWQPLPLIGWDIFDFSSETAELNSMNLDKKQDLKTA